MTIVCLHSGPGAAELFASQLGAFDGSAWETPAELTLRPAVDSSVEEWVTAAAQVIAETDDGQRHVLATGEAAYGAIMLAAEHPGLVTSLVLGDPVVDESDDNYWRQMKRVQCPALVVASAPDRATDVAQAQSVAGGIANGVFVIIDGCEAPAHKNRDSSFNEWLVSFFAIAEGLRSLSDPSEPNQPAMEEV
ncbi:alpha/beta fold hydrolase [Hoyosella subflava]|uniref:Alpha/beta hydrolase n=1 Tax=Hoyosella subflava (strain DSM 45089 / JCM 17490 / NBRC 109087 / DQS3-9A1) TaxID=443218 RepID=F6EFM2_HOYSD|nr:alpha/beta hydrolase [Hoyosella subflava]AEF40951.1 hypothetical protein AS9A_2504 [Hoyosella subflava DQS3-9A1]